MENGFQHQRMQYRHQSRSPSLPPSNIPSHAIDSKLNDLAPQANNGGDINAIEAIASGTKRKRASKACDACRVRKVKCEGTRNPCPQCDEHGIPCLYTVPLKRRGPVNAYVELQKQKLELEAQGMSFEPLHPALGHTTMSEQRSEQLGNSNAHQARVDRGLEELAAPHILNLIFDDFFKFVYPIAPIIVEPAFRRVLSDASLHDEEFLALAGSILGCTLACLRSSESMYGGLTVEHTYQFATTRLGLNYRDRLNLQVAATLEYLSLASIYAHPLKTVEENPRATILAAEFAACVSNLLCTQFDKMNFVEQQLLKRMYQFICYIQISCTMQGSSKLQAHQKHQLDEHAMSVDLIPVDISDAELDQSDSHVGTQNAPQSDSGLKSYVPGLLFLSHLYAIFAESHDIRHDKTLPKYARYAGLCQTLHKIQHALDNAPEQLQQTGKNSDYGIGFEVQKANLLISKMHISSILLQQLEQLEIGLDDSSPSVEKISSRDDLGQQRRQVITETLHITKSVSRRALEANGLIKKIRSIASSLVDIIQGKHNSENDGLTARKELSEFVEILGTLDTGDDNNRAKEALDEKNIKDLLMRLHSEQHVS